MKDPKYEQPNNSRDVIVYVESTGWMMGNYECGVWRLYFSDTGLQITKYPELIIKWCELPDKPI